MSTIRKLIGREGRPMYIANSDAIDAVIAKDLHTFHQYCDDSVLDVEMRAGTSLRTDYLWGYTDHGQGGPGKPVDVMLNLDRDMGTREALRLLWGIYCAAMVNDDCHPREAYGCESIVDAEGFEGRLQYMNTGT